MTDPDKQLQILKACAHPVRLKILKLLAKGENCVQDVNKLLEVSQPNLSQHMGILKNSGLVDNRIKGSKRCYFLSMPTFTVNLINLLEIEHNYVPCEKVQKILEKKNEI